MFDRLQPSSTLTLSVSANKSPGVEGENLPTGAQGCRDTARRGVVQPSTLCAGQAERYEPPSRAAG